MKLISQSITVECWLRNIAQFFHGSIKRTPSIISGHLRRSQRCLLNSGFTVYGLPTTILPILTHFLTRSQTFAWLSERKFRDKLKRTQTATFGFNVFFSFPNLWIYRVFIPLVFQSRLSILKDRSLPELEGTEDGREVALQPPFAN